MWWFVVGFFSSKLHKMRIPPFLKGLLGRPGPQILDDAWVLRPGSDRDLWAAGGGGGWGRRCVPPPPPLAQGAVRTEGFYLILRDLFLLLYDKAQRRSVHISWNLLAYTRR